MVKYWKNGGRWSIWATELQVIEKFIRKNELQPLDKITAAAYIDREDNPAMLGPAIQPSVNLMDKRGISISTWEEFHSIYGGMRVPHLHFRGEIYMLNNDQWNEFSHRMLKQFSVKLDTANAVSFDQLMDVSESVTAMG
ncbi:MAG: hypothetical protein PVI97_17430 [Candidatus Thiodiazotropha sp.]|jgi:hypothetical protein